MIDPCDAGGLYAERRQLLTSSIESSRVRAATKLRGPRTETGLLRVSCSWPILERSIIEPCACKAVATTSIVLLRLAWLGFAAWQPDRHAAGLRLHDRSHLPSRSRRLHAGTAVRRRRALRGHRAERPVVDSPGRSSRPAQCSRSATSAAKYFGEGITICKYELFQLTWQSGVAFVYDRADVRAEALVQVPGEGLGADRTIEHSLIMSDGTEFLRFLDPATFAERRRVRVTGVGAPLKNLNELEFVKGEMLRQRLDDRLHRAHRSRDRARHRLHRSARPPAAARSAQRIDVLERHRLRRRRRPPVRHRQALAEAVRNRLEA